MSSASFRSAHAPGWTTLGDVTSVERLDGGALIRCGRAAVRITPQRAGIVRVRLSATGVFGRDHSWAVVPEGGAAVPLRFEEYPDELRLASELFSVRIHRQPCRVSFQTILGEVVAADDANKAMAWAGDECRCWKVLRADDHVFGLGERAGGLDKRGGAWVNWNTDAFNHQPWSDPLYQSHPFLMVVNGGRAHGLFFDNAYRSSFDLGALSRSAYSFGAEGGEMNYYFIPGPTPAEVVERYTHLVGRMPLPPRWALGFQQCRWSYESAGRVRKVAREFRRRRIPCDVIYLDIDYMDEYRVFTWNMRRFPSPSRLMSELARGGFKVVAIVDPGVKVDRGYSVYDDAVAAGHLVRKPDGKHYVGKVWPGDSVYPDFTRPETRNWWGRLYRGMCEAGVAGFWNDMNEPADFVGPDKMVPLDLIHDNEGEPVGHRAVHNVYGMLMARASYEGLRALRPDERPFVLTRAGFAGVQRYAAVWTGDNASSWDHLRVSLPMQMNMGLSGLVMCGADIGGFSGISSAELFTRWLQAGIFSPLCRVHTAGGPEQDPFAYGRKHEAINRKTIELRYRLLPYLYSEFRHHVQTGLPILRPLVLDFPAMPDVHHCETEFMFGRQILVAPVVDQGATKRALTLPPGDWYDFDTAAPRVGGGRTELAVTLESIPMFAKAGAVIPMQPVVQHVDERPLDELTLNIFPGVGGGSFYHDDGRTFGYANGQFTAEEYRVRTTKDLLTLEVASRQGIDRFAPRSYLLRFNAVERPPAAVAAGGQPLAQARTAVRFGRVASGWWHDRAARLLWVRIGRLSPGDVVEVLLGEHRRARARSSAARLRRSRTR